MLTRKSLRRNIKQTTALIERNIFFELRFKLVLFTSFLNPFIQIAMPLIIFGAIFSISGDYSFGYWSGQNYLLFLLIAFCIQFLRRIVENFRQLFFREKFWKTLQALMVAPINRYVLLFGILISEMILLSIPFAFFLILTIIIFPIPILNLLIVLGLFFCLAIFFGSLGLIVGVLIITKEGIYRVFKLGLTFLYWLSCVSYPLQIFPEIVQNVIVLNPLYYFIDLIRIFWLMGIDYNLAISFLTPLHIIMVSIFTILLPIFSVVLFNIFYKKYGITGY
ncbi:MAG: ABC transporter permease [Candidatus Lokiarchaeota archaeon]|nr:ABC transporter permease [Candidatus Lokiarchaeota archaeon]